MTSGNKQTWEFTGFEGCKVTKVVAHLHNNKSAGNGSLTSKNNGVDEANCHKDSISGLGKEYKEITISETPFIINGDFVITISATVNSVYCDYIEITYEK